MSLLDQFLAEALKEHPVQRRVIQYPAPEVRRGTIRNLLQADSMDGMRFRYWFTQPANQSKDLDQWRELVDKQMLELQK